MTYIIAQPCVDVRDRGCVDVCPVDCIYEVEDTELSEGDEAYKPMLYIHPEECIDCGACEPECPVEAIFPEDEVPDDMQDFIGYNYKAFGLDAP
ncbi:MAG: ferredoxin family protein [Deferribacteres bacterium]|nr:ferredoxin family protein [candidate division KSB1 bacterium]MCB9511574.1 ferredoxin family protein [Deferribacteres bacterium]